MQKSKKIKILNQEGLTFKDEDIEFKEKLDNIDKIYDNYILNKKNLLSKQKKTQLIEQNIKDIGVQSQRSSISTSNVKHLTKDPTSGASLREAYLDFQSREEEIEILSKKIKNKTSVSLENQRTSDQKDTDNEDICEMDLDDSDFDTNLYQNRFTTSNKQQFPNDASFDIQSSTCTLGTNIKASDYIYDGIPKDNIDKDEFSASIRKNPDTKNENEAFGSMMEEQLIQCFYRDRNPSSLQIKSYNNFISDKIPKIFENCGVTQVKIPDYNHERYIRISFVGKTTFIRPKIIQDDHEVILYPSTCRLLKNNYVSKIRKDVHIQIVEYNYSHGERHEKIISDIIEKNMILLYLPTMVGSILCNTKIDERIFKNEDGSVDETSLKRHHDFLDKECCYDTGGYFISTGNEKVVISQIGSSKNEIMVHSGNKSIKKPNETGDADNHTGSGKKIEKVNPSDLYAEINSVDCDQLESYVKKFTIKSIDLSKFIRDTGLKLFSKNSQNDKNTMFQKYPNLKKYGKEGQEPIVVCYFGKIDTENAVPIPVLLRALGIRNDLEISTLICNDSTFLNSVYKSNENNEEQSRNCYSTENCSKKSEKIMNQINATLLFCQEMELTTQKKCIGYIANRMYCKNRNMSEQEKIERATTFLNDYFLPHIFSRKDKIVLDRLSEEYMSLSEEEKQKKEHDVEVQNEILQHEKSFHKCLFVCNMVHKYINVLIGRSNITNRDSLKYKTVDMVGDLMAIIFTKTLEKIKKDFKRNVEYRWKNGFNIVNALKMCIDKNKQSMQYCIATGNWCLNNKENQESRNDKKILKIGVTQMMNTQNINARHACLNIINSSLDENMKSAKPRQLQTTNWGMICPDKTPEGKKIGLVNEFSIFTQNSYSRSAERITTKLIEIGNKLNKELKHKYQNRDLKDKNKKDDDVTGEKLKKGTKKSFDVDEQIEKKKKIVIENTKLNNNNRDINNSSKNKRAYPEENTNRFTYPNKIFYNYDKEKILFTFFETTNDMIYLIFNENELIKQLDTKEKLEKYEQKRFAFINLYCSSVKIFVNSNLIGLTKNPRKFIDMCTQSKKSPIKGELPYDCSISFDAVDKEIRIRCYGGRFCRPLLTVENNRLKFGEKMLKNIFKSNLLIEQRKLISAGRKKEVDKDLKDFDFIDWAKLVEKGLIEYVDTFEEESSLISMYSHDLLKKYDHDLWIKFNFSHCELTACSILGHAASCIPYPQCNQAPRNVYQAAMGIQAQGTYSTRDKYRIDNNSQILWYGQKPLVTTEVAKNTNFHDMPTGINPVVAIMTYTGYNQEDSIIFNQAALDRGALRAFTQLTMSDMIDYTKNNYDGIVQSYCNPYYANLSKRKYQRQDCQHLDEDGLPKVGVTITKGMVVIGKICVQNGYDPITQTTREIVSDLSVKWKKDIAQRVIDVILTYDDRGRKVVHVKLISTRIPQIGDKFSSRHGQKGTIGMIYREEDMPYTNDGIRPDIIINPHAIPSRMTIGQLVEMVTGTVCSILGEEFLATPFLDYTNRRGGKSNAEVVCSLLKECGYNFDGKQTMYCGFTSKMLEQRIYIGVCYYQRLRHNVEDKMQARQRGPKEILTRQPTHGKARDGGIRFGEMERDCIIAHGAALFLRDRTMVASDEYPIVIHNLCGLIAIWNTKRKMFLCQRCNDNNPTNFTQTSIPYAMKLLIQELMGLSLAPRLFI